MSNSKTWKPLKSKNPDRVASLDAVRDFTEAHNRLIAARREGAAKPCDVEVFVAVYRLVTATSKVVDRYVTVERIREYADLHSETVRESLKRLSDLGVIVWQPGKGNRHGLWRGGLLSVLTPAELVEYEASRPSPGTASRDDSRPSQVTVLDPVPRLDIQEEEQHLQEGALTGEAGETPPTQSLNDQEENPDPGQKADQAQDSVRSQSLPFGTQSLPAMTTEAREREAEPDDSPGVYVLSVDEKPVNGGTLYRVKLSDRRNPSTFNDEMGARALRFQVEGQPVDVRTATNKKGYLDLLEIAEVGGLSILPEDAEYAEYERQEQKRELAREAHEANLRAQGVLFDLSAAEVDRFMNGLTIIRDARGESAPPRPPFGHTNWTNAAMAQAFGNEHAELSREISKRRQAAAIPW